VGGTCGSVHAQTFNNNLKELGVVESRNTVRKGLVLELLNAQDTVLCSQRSGERGVGRNRRSENGQEDYARKAHASELTVHVYCYQKHVTRTQPKRNKNSVLPQDPT
jgi:hypothetical protein